MDNAVAMGFVKTALSIGTRALAGAGAGLGAAGALAGGAGLVQSQRTRTDVKTMRTQSRAADALHSAMLFEGRTGQRIPEAMRRRVGVNYMAANQAYRRRFGSAKKPAAAAK